MGRSYPQILAEEAGFTTFGNLNMEALICRPEVRDMCADGRCGRYGTCWSCPPACGSIEENAQKMKQYHRGILLQTTAAMEDDFDYEAIKEAEQRHKKSFCEMVDRMRTVYPECLPLGAGTCTICAQCTSPDAPCRFPSRRFSSMEACGLLVSDVCEKSGIPYNHGKQTITFVSCILY